MNKALSIAIAVAMSSPLYAVAGPTFYGKANVSYSNASIDNDFADNTLDTDDSALVLDSNASRLGVKGSESLADTGLDVIYQAEFEVAFDDGDNGGETFSQRNIFVGVKGDFGSVIAGHFDTPLKTAQNKVDLFNDLKGDIKNIVTVNDNRESNSIMYTSPSFAGFTLFGDIISSEQDGVSNGTSLAVTYDNAGFYGAVAYALDVAADGASAVRGVFQYTFKSFQLGLLAEQSEPADGADKVNGSFVSLKYTINKWALLGQYGQSDIYREDGQTFSLGADYKLSKNAKLFGFYTDNSYETTAVDSQATYLGMGMEVKF